MALTARNGIWHWRKVVQGNAFARSTETGDKKLAEQTQRFKKRKRSRKSS